MPDFLMEIGTEEIPASYIRPALKELGEKISEFLSERLKKIPPVKTAATPRRLIICIPDLAEGVPEEKKVMTGPAEKIAFDENGELTKAGEGFLRSTGMTKDDVTIQETKKGRYISVEKVIPGKKTIDILSENLSQAVSGLSFPKSMYWTAEKKRFARPVRRILAMLGSEVVPFEFNGVKSGRTSAGHPFLAPESFDVKEAGWECFLEELRNKKVIADITERRELIHAGILEKLAEAGAKKEVSKKMLEEVTQLVEFPDVVEGKIPEKFLRLPKEVMIESMESHQRYFPVIAEDGSVMPAFLTVSNRAGHTRQIIAEGNQRVLSARLSDACFFLDQDTRAGLESFVPRLKTMIFHQKLGTYLEKTAVLKKLAGKMAELLLPDKKSDAVRAAHLCKADLLSAMVYEFAGLQGVMGREYALREGEKEEVAAAIEEHYLPAGQSAGLPETQTGALLALADKLDTVAAMFHIGETPSASSDPFALRRQMIGIIRILFKQGWQVSVKQLFEMALDAREFDHSSLSEVIAFYRDRLRQYVKREGFRQDFIQAVMELRPDEPVDVLNRVEALKEIDGAGELEKLATAVERAARISKDTDADKIAVDESKLAEPEEKKLYSVLKEISAPFTGKISQGSYVEAGKLYAESFSDTLHTFFDQVLVMCDDQELKNNRLRLLRSIHLLFKENFADLEKVSYK